MLTIMAADANVDGLTLEQALEVIKSKPLNDLTENDIAFLRARESYLTDDERERYLSGNVKPASDDEAGPTRDELEAEATALELTFTDKTSDKALAKKIADAKSE